MILGIWCAFMFWLFVIRPGHWPWDWRGNPCGIVVKRKKRDFE